ncbi:metacaspase-1-like [Magnolia sinica]|uniref:metacaspase-1-like n=1 Tax=Magnolia sinica TaxID=86752 RepID=UPI00265A844A|nr:metacaspase-1-like [Magnolia sinica]
MPRAGRTESCSRCRVQLLVPPEARTIRCAVCQAITTVRSEDPIVRVNEQVRQAVSWVKGLLSNVSNNTGSYAMMPNYQAGTLAPSFGNYIPQMPAYPQAHGKKRALLCGVSYRLRRCELKGSVNDVKCMKYLLCDKFGFSNECILLLTEEERDPYRIPTKQNIRMALRWLVMGCQPGDSLVFHYSGHGSQQINYSGDELDGHDETLCPVDYETEGMIVDDEINTTIVRPLPKGAKLHAIIDACHSGTVLDLPFVCKMNRAGFYQWENHSPLSGVNKGTSGGLAISFSGCDDNQTSADTSALSGDTMTGAMTFCFIQAVNSEPGMTYGRILTAMRSAIRDTQTGIRLSSPIASLIRTVIRAGLKQEPQLSSSEQFDIYRRQFLL